MPRPKLKENQEAESIKAAASLTGIPLTVLMWAKGQGCPAFQHGRVKIVSLRGWLTKNKPPADVNKNEELSIRLKILRCERQEIENANARSELQSTAEVARKVLAIGEEIRSTLKTQLVDQLPALNAGLDATAQRENNRRAFDEIIGRFQSWAKSWTQS